MNVLSVILLLFGALFSIVAADNKHIFCYWDTEASKRKNQSNFRSWHITAKLCTHLVYGSSIGIDPNGSGALKIVDEELHVKKGLITEALTMKRDNLKIIISIGEWKEDCRRFSKMVADVRMRDKFFASLLRFMLEWNFDGVFIDWEFPSQLNGQAEDRENFVSFLQELKAILKERDFLLIVAVSARLDKNTLMSYDIPKIAKHVDYISLITHDHLDPFSRKIEHGSPLYGYGTRGVERSVNHWINNVEDKSKLLLGVQLFGQTYTLKDRENTIVGAPSKGPGRQHNLSRRPGYMTYGEFCQQASQWHIRYDTLAQVPYAYKDDQWISYENARSISAKMQLVKQKQLGGALVWSIDADDFHGYCGEQYSLLRVIVSGIGNPNVLTTQKPTTEGIGICPREGLFRHPWECNLYYECRDTKRTDYECPKGKYFDEKKGECKPANEVNCPQDFVVWRPGMKLYNHRNLPLNLKIVM